MSFRLISLKDDENSVEQSDDEEQLNFVQAFRSGKKKVSLDSEKTFTLVMPITD